MGSSNIIMPKGEHAREYMDWESYLQAFDVIPRGETWGPAYWCGTGSMGETLDLARRGWPEGMKHVRTVTMPAVRAAASRHVPEEGWAWDVTGAAYDVGEYLSGAPECWLAPAPQRAKPALSVLVSITPSASVPESSIRMRGAAVAGLVLRLQADGYAVDLWSAWGVEHYDLGTRWCRVRLSDPHGGPLDTDRILFALAHPAAGRQLGHFMCSHGMPINNPPWKADLYLPCMHAGATDWSDLDAVTRWVETTYQTLTEDKAA